MGLSYSSCFSLRSSLVISTVCLSGQRRRLRDRRQIKLPRRIEISPHLHIPTGPMSPGATMMRGLFVGFVRYPDGRHEACPHISSFAATLQVFTSQRYFQN
ncbi:uncharacterized [Tachysurus ichikawai]